MADKDPDHEEGSESLGATAMFLRALTPEQQQAAPKPEPPPPASPAPAQDTGAGDFTRMFRPVLSSEPKPASPSPASPPNLTGPSGGDFTRAFVVPASPPDQASPVHGSAPSKAKGFSTPGVSDSASAEGSFTRIFRPDPLPVAPRQSVQPGPGEPFRADLAPLAHDLPLDSAFFSKTEQTPSPSQGAGVTELFSKLSAGEGKRADEGAYQPEPTPAPRPYTEPTLLARPEKPAEVMPPGGGVTALLNRLTGESQLPTSPLPAQPTPIRQELPPPTTPSDTRGEFTRIIDAAQVQAALSPGNAAPPPPAAPPPASAAPLIVLAPNKLPVVPPVPVAPHLPPLVPPPAPKVSIPPPAIQPPAKTKLQEMVPFLLVANAFLMLILILLVAFALHRR